MSCPAPHRFRLAPCGSGGLGTGCGGFDLAVLPVRAPGWCAETDQHAAAVLAARYPDVLDLGDGRGKS